MLWSLFLPPLCQVDNSLYHRFTPHHLQIGPEVKIFRARPSHNQTLSLIRAESTVSDGIVMLSPLVSGTNPRLILTSLASRDQSTNGIIMSPLWTLWLCNPVSYCIEQSAVTVIDLICQLHISPHPIMCQCCPHNSNLINSGHPGYLKHILDQLISQYIRSVALCTSL